MSDLDLYRQSKALEITDIYNANIFKQYNDINKYILTEINSSNTALQKQQQITLYIKQLYNTSRAFDASFQTDISNVQILLPISITDPSNLLPKKAKLFGINYIVFPGNIDPPPYLLKGCWQDVADVSARLTQKGFINIDIITDASTSLIQPTKNNIQAEITSLLSSGNSGDILFLMYSGHGAQLSDRGSLKDEIDFKDEQIVSSDYQFISDDYLKDIIMKNLKKNVTLVAVFDSCYSGSILDLKYTYIDGSNNVTINNNTLETPGNVILISGSTDSQTSADATINGRPNGAMTWSLLESLKNNPNITWRQLILNMRSLLSEGFYTQIPQLSSGTFIDIDKPVFI